MTLGGHACGQMLCILEDIFGLPESEESKRFDQGLVPETDPDETLPEGAEDYPPASQNPSPSLSSSPSQQQGVKHPILSNLLAPPEAATKTLKLSSEPKGKQGELPLDSATPFLVSSEKEITMVRVSLNDICLGRSTVARNPRGGQSVYQCRACSYITEQKAQAATHVRKYHSHSCIQCRLCTYRTYSTVDFKPHLEHCHPGMQSQWYEPVLKIDLSAAHLEEIDPDDLPAGIKQEITSSGED